LNKSHIFTDKDPIEDILPKEGWLWDYVDFTNGLEACARFRFFTAASMLGATVHNKIWIQRGDADLLPKLFPNPWVLLLAPPGRGHKTSTINMGVNCIMQGCPEVRILADKLTPESLVKALSEPAGPEKIRIGPRDATGLIKAPELSVFFGKQQYNVGLVSLITDLYDYREEWASETIMRGKSVLRNICISIIGGSTPDWLHRMLPEDAFTGGFMRRFIIVEMPATYFRRRALPKYTSQVTWPDLVQRLRQFNKFDGEMQWTKRGEKAYIDHYETLYPTGDVQRDAYQEGETEQILKLAMLLALSEHSMKVRQRHMFKAREILNCLMEETAPRIGRLATHPRMHLVPEIQDTLKRFGKLSHGELTKKMYKGLSMGEQQFMEAIRMMRIAGDIKVDGAGTKAFYSLPKQDKKIKVR